MEPRAWGQERRILHDPRNGDVPRSPAAFQRNLFRLHRPFDKQCSFFGLLLDAFKHRIREIVKTVASGQRGARDGDFHWIQGRLFGNNQLLTDSVAHRRDKLVQWRRASQVHQTSGVKVASCGDGCHGVCEGDCRLGVAEVSRSLETVFTRVSKCRCHIFDHRRWSCVTTGAGVAFSITGEGAV